MPIVLLCLPLLIIGGAVAGAGSPVVGVTLLAIGIGIMVAFSGALGGVFSTALYRFAVDGEAPRGFYEGDLAEAFRPRKKRGWPSRS